MYECVAISLSYLDLPIWFKVITSETKIAPKNRPSQKDKIIFQPLDFPWRAVGLPKCNCEIPSWIPQMTNDCIRWLWWLFGKIFVVELWQIENLNHKPLETQLWHDKISTQCQNSFWNWDSFHGRCLDRVFQIQPSWWNGLSCCQWIWYVNGVLSRDLDWFWQ